VPQRLLDRLAAAGAVLLTLRPDGAATVHGSPPPIVRKLSRSRAFAEAARRLWPRLEQAEGELVELWPGAWLTPVSLRRRRRTQDAAPVDVLLLLGEQLIDGEMLHVVCDQQSLDHRAAVAGLLRQPLLTEREAHRLAMLLAWTVHDTAELERHGSELRTMSRQLGESYEELSLLYTMSSSLSVNSAPPQVLADACAELQQVVGLRWMALLLLDDDGRLNQLSGRMFVAGQADSDETFLRRIGRSLATRCGDDTEPRIIEDVASFGVPALTKLARNVLVVFLGREGKPLGVMFGGDKLNGERISSVDSKLCDSLASSLAIFLENAMLYEDVQAMFMGTLHALTASIDAKDSYTRGHSERVALLSRMLAQAAGLDEPAVERVYIAGLVHDVGKIGVPESVLCKPGKLTPQEYDLIKQHPEIGARILEDIRQMADLIPGVLYHHERWDGNGYPHRLAGEEIPMFGRLICLADSFDAMSSNRTYRGAMPLDRVIREVRDHAGAQFDPRLAQLFLQLDFSQFFEQLHAHQQEHEQEARELSHGQETAVT
jgi:HD-GYP domain-containing protein (c-di-GMP phosphodiesterase class II)